MRYWWTASLAKVRLHKSHVFSRPRLTSERPRGHSVLRQVFYCIVGKVCTITAWLTDWRCGPQTMGLNSPRCHTPISSCNLVSISEILCETVPARNFTNQRADGSISESLLSRSSTSGYIGGDFLFCLFLSKWGPCITSFSYYELYKTKWERYAQLRIDEHQ